MRRRADTEPITLVWRWFPTPVPAVAVVEMEACDVTKRLAGRLRVVGRGRSPSDMMPTSRLIQHAGYSINPGGRRKYTKGAKERMGEVTPEVVEFWIATMRNQSEEMCHRMRASENIAWGFLGKPAQQVFAAHAHLDISDIGDLTKGTDKLDGLAAMYGAMLGAVDEPPMIDVTSRSSALAQSRALPAPTPSVAELRAEFEAEEAERQQRVRRPRHVERIG
jgi:hypothetical protein